MNDFTLEELEILEGYLRKETVIPDKPYLHLNLLRKLQRMIDTYTEIKTPTMEDYGLVEME